MTLQQPEETENVFGPDYDMVPIVGAAETPAELVALLHAAHRRDQVTSDCTPPPDTRFRPAADGGGLTQPRRNRRRVSFRCRQRSRSAATQE